MEVHLRSDNRNWKTNIFRVVTCTVNNSKNPDRQAASSIEAKFVNYECKSQPDRRRLLQSTEEPLLKMHYPGVRRCHGGWVNTKICFESF